MAKFGESWCLENGKVWKSKLELVSSKMATLELYI